VVASNSYNTDESRVAAYDMLHCWWSKDVAA